MLNVDKKRVLKIIKKSNVLSYLINPPPFETNPCGIICQYAIQSGRFCIPCLPFCCQMENGVASILNFSLAVYNLRCFPHATPDPFLQDTKQDLLQSKLHGSLQSSKSVILANNSQQLKCKVV